MTFNKSNVIVSGSRSSLSEYANYTTVYPKPAMVGGKIVLTQDMINKQNVKYIIKWNFDLDDETITVPEGCLIEFDGGSFSNGTLVGNETILVYNQEEEDVFKNVSLEGSFKRSTSAIADKMDNTNGMAKIYLKKNKPLATQLTQPNTIYVIQYDFTLGEDITVPANCVLEFDGGSISGAHTITGNNTGIQAVLVKIFNTDVTLNGSWNVAEAYPEWFGAKGNGVSDDRAAIQKCVDCFNKTHLSSKTYILSTKVDDVCINLPEKHILTGENNFLVSKPTLKATCAPLWVVVVSGRCRVESVSIDGGLDAQGGSYKDLTKTCGIGSKEEWAAGLIIRNNFVFKCYYAFNFVTYLSEITHNSCLSCYHGFFIHGYGMSTPESIPSAYGTSTLVEGNYANGCQGTGYAIIGLSYSTIQANAADNCGYDGIEFNYVYRLDYLKNVSILANGAEGCMMVYHVAGCSNISIRNCSVWLKKINGYTASTLHPITISALTSSLIKGFSFSTNGSGFDEGELDNYVMLYKSGVGGSMELNEIRLDNKILTANQVTIGDSNDLSQIKYITPSIGDTSHRPSDFDYKIGRGSTYFDTDIRQFIIWENGWKTVDGFKAFKRVGTTNERPWTGNIGAGFSYYDTTLGKPIWYNGTAWVDATGTPV